jgi:endoglucanase
MTTRRLLEIVLWGSSFALLGCQGEQPGDRGVDEIGARSLTSEAAPTCRPGDRMDLYAPPPSNGSLDQVRDLWRARSYADALKLLALVTEPHAAWFVTGTPDEVRKAVRQTMTTAEKQHRVPVLVAYNLPYRDCAQYSAGGAIDTAAYKAWIDGFARGIGNGKAIVVLEPDGLGLIPYNTTIYGEQEWCRPTVPDPSGTPVPAPGASPVERYAQLNYAVDSLAAHAPGAAVYLDASNSGWLSPGEAAYRLTKAGALRARGFFLNVSNYQLTSENTQFGTWLSMALAAPSGAPSWAFDDQGNFHFDWLPSQYDPANNYAVNYSPAYAATVTAGIQSFMGSAVATASFVIDTGRNGQGPLDTARYAQAPFNQPASVVSGLKAGYWCNGYGAGAGLRPSTRTGVAHLDAYLWIKVPGESDGSCDIAGGARAWDFGAYNPWGLSGDAQNHFDPLWGQADPQAGIWFPAQGLQLAQKANPALL